MRIRSAWSGGTGSGGCVRGLRRFCWEAAAAAAPEPFAPVAAAGAAAGTAAAAAAADGPAAKPTDPTSRPGCRQRCAVRAIEGVLQGAAKVCAKSRPCIERSSCRPAWSASSLCAAAAAASAGAAPRRGETFLRCLGAWVGVPSQRWLARGSLTGEAI